MPAEGFPRKVKGRVIRHPEWVLKFAFFPCDCADAAYKGLQLHPPNSRKIRNYPETFNHRIGGIKGERTCIRFIGDRGHWEARGLQKEETGVVEIARELQMRSLGFVRGTRSNPASNLGGWGIDIDVYTSGTSETVTVLISVVRHPAVFSTAILEHRSQEHVSRK